MGLKKKIVFYGSEDHYVDHMLPIMRNVDKGLVYAGIHTKLKTVIDFGSLDVIVVASYKDLVSVRGLGYSKKIVYMSHGADQKYKGIAREHANYYAGGEREGVDLILTPGPYGDNAYKTSELTKHIKTVQIGCPKLLGMTKKSLCSEVKNIGLCFHWDCKVCPETEATYHEWMPIFEQVKRELGAEKYRYLLFKHPRITDMPTNTWDQHDFWQFIQHLDVLFCDNSSLGIEAASLGIPVRFLDSTKYRWPAMSENYNPEHGLRFSEYMWIKTLKFHPDDKAFMYNWIVEDIEFNTCKVEKLVQEAYGGITPEQGIEKAKNAILELLT